MILASKSLIFASHNDSFGAGIESFARQALIFASQRPGVPEKNGIFRAIIAIFTARIAILATHIAIFALQSLSFACQSGIFAAQLGGFVGGVERPLQAV